MPAIALAEIEPSAALDGTSVLYRLAYADAQQLQPYGLARWTMTPAQLVRQRLRDALGQRGPVVNAGDANVPLTLRVELDEFSHLFEAPDKSTGLVRLRAHSLLRHAQPDGEVGDRRALGKFHRIR